MEANFPRFSWMQKADCAVSKSPLKSERGQGEYKAKNNVCFLFALMVLCSSLFSTGASCAVFRTVF
jgi:hypothetical protein